MPRWLTPGLLLAPSCIYTCSVRKLPTSFITAPADAIPSMTGAEWQQFLKDKRYVCVPRRGLSAPQRDVCGGLHGCG